MQANKNKAGSTLVAVSLLLACTLTITGWLLLGRPADWFRWTRPDPTQQALELIRTRYVDLVSIDSLRGLSLDSLVFKLDPHSAYIDPSIVHISDEDLAGNFAGIGIEFGSIQDTITVIRPIPGSPSEQAGLQIGDQLLAIEGRSLTVPTITLDSIRVIVRGPVGSVANLTILRQGKLFNVAIKRAEIPTPSIVGEYMLNDTTGYIKLTKFATGSYRETVMAIERLLGKGMRALVLDLRNNGGGFMNEAVELADEFLSDDRLIVYTEGAHLKKRSFFCKRPGLFEKGKLLVLMNELSASASEVLAGSLQDWCRATIIGRRSYGKGLVQEQFQLSNNGALRLTVARYYTPLGRCIQRPYSNDRFAYMHDSLFNQVLPNSKNTHQLTYFSTCGDTLFAGGGIWPNRYVSKSPNRMSAEVEKIMNNSAIVIWAYRFYQSNKKTIDAIPDMSNATDKIPAADIRSFLTDLLVVAGFRPNTFTSDDWQILSYEVYAQIARFRFGPGEYTRFNNTIDPFILAAQNLL